MGEEKCKMYSDSDGIGITVVAETDTGCLFGGSGLNQRRHFADGDYDEIGRMAARELIQDWHYSKNGCTDRWLQDQLIIFMALAKGTSRMATCTLGMHTKTAIHIAQLLTGAKFDVKTSRDGTVIVECEGIGHSEKRIKENMKMLENAAHEHDNGDHNSLNEPKESYLT